MKWSAHLPTVHTYGHDGAKHADIVEVVAHPGAYGLDIVAFLFGSGGFDVFGLVGALMFGDERLAALDIDFVAGFVAACDVDEIADFAFDGDIGDEALHGLGVDAGQVARVGIAVGVAVGTSNSRTKSWRRVTSFTMALVMGVLLYASLKSEDWRCRRRAWWAWWAGDRGLPRSFAFAGGEHVAAFVRALVVVAKGKQGLVFEAQDARECLDAAHDFFDVLLQTERRASIVAFEFGEVGLRAAQEASEDGSGSRRCGAEEAVNDGGFADGEALGFGEYGEQTPGAIGDVGGVVSRSVMRSS